jgi:hypothetical protein|tara:strand:+ start:692 stop:1021 length:330 start_codon:yes stop_codon:yes gene_type:complete
MSTKNVSRRLKRKQKTSKKESPMSEKKDTNGLLTRDICFSLEQADLAKNLLQAVNHSRDVHIETQSKWEAFLIGVGMRAGDEIVGGDLDSDDPDKRCLTIKTSNGIAKE